MNDLLNKLTERMPGLSLLVHFLIAGGMIAFILALSALAEWLGRIW